ncbi:MAG: DUF4136 domain-containing protein [Thermoanaerobaculia bacterium]|nr:DUF4136 domain-containing protein [Thermoanaerobaculia bacterium]
MKFRNILTFAALVLTVSGCSSLEVKSAAAPGTSFAGKKTFAFYDAPAGLMGRSPAQVEFLNQRINPLVKESFTKKGYVLSTPENADILIATQVSVDGTVDAVRWGYTLVAWDPWGGYAGGVHADARSFKTGMLVVDVVDGKGKNLVYRGWAKDVLRLHGDKTQDDFAKILGKMLEGIPPMKG